MFALKSPQALPSARPSGRAATASRSAVVTAVLPEAAATADRRALLLGGLAAGMLSAQPALAYTKPSSALCVLQDNDDSADACRQAEISKDFNVGGQQEGYNTAKSTSKTGALVGVACGRARGCVWEGVEVWGAEIPRSPQPSRFTRVVLSSFARNGPAISSVNSLTAISTNQPRKKGGHQAKASAFRWQAGLCP